MVISGNMLSHLSVIETLNGSNYGSWRETIEIVLALWEIDFALTTDAPKELAEPVIRDGEATEAFATRQRDLTPIKMAYDLERVKWDASNHKCLMVVKSSIKEAIRGGIPNCETANEYLKKVDNQFTGSSKTYARYKFKLFKTEVENQHDIKIKIVKFDHVGGGEYSGHHTPYG
jgi:hypothetical protein